MPPFVGIDFGTTNTAVGVADRDGPPRLAHLPSPSGEPSPTWRTVVHFEPGERSREMRVEAGGFAIERYLESDGEGRLLQSIKSYLASALFSRTNVFGRTWTLEQLIGVFLRKVRDAVEDDLGTRAVVGRPVRYWGQETDEDEERAVTRMRESLRLAGFGDVVFEYEPIAAAARYADRLDHEELVFIGDFGGGTSDFSLIRVGPEIPPGDASAILATGGVGIGGDAFDARIVDAAIAPVFGKGTSYRDEFGAVTPVPGWLYNKLRRWHHLSFLRSTRTLSLLERIHAGAETPQQIAHLIHIVEHDLGLPLHRAIEQVKVSLSHQDAAALRFIHAPIALVSHLDRARFDDWIAPDIATIEGVVDDVLRRAGVPASQVDRVFMTGGSSFVPAVRSCLERRFHPDLVVGGDELTSVAWGLAARARQIFG